MLGGMLAGHTESAGQEEIINDSINGKDDLALLPVPSPYRRALELIPKV